MMMGPQAAYGTMLAGEKPFTASSFRREPLNDSERSFADRVLRGLLEDDARHGCRLSG